MQFVTNGPDIPDSLLQAQEEGRVVFFCGAGISYKVGLKDFKWLVDEIYRLCGTCRTSIEDKAYTKNQFDTTLNILEDRLPKQRAGLAMRKALATALQPNLRRKGSAETHTALLQLSRNRKGALRLVTTNFDRVFEQVAHRAKQQHSSYAAPMLPIPKNSQWDGLVYLHGLLPAKKEDEKALDRLVATSGDFGLAYLTERWAARFVTELFRNYVVCFVGYSINDPVLRYMMDALAADRLRGEVTPQAYALGAYELGFEAETIEDWKSKGITPILYDSANSHALLHDTLKVWAEDYQNGVRGKERMVVEHAIANPTESTQQDDFVGRMLWALSDKSGLPAKRFADFVPTPALTWLLETFSDNRFKFFDLARYGVPPYDEVDDKLRFSLIHRPAPYTKAPWMGLASGGGVDSEWDDVMFQLARWLTMHLNDPKLILWLAQQGGQLHDRFTWLIDDKLNEIARLEREGKTSELDEIRDSAPNAIPSPLMRSLWRLLLAGRVKAPWLELDLYRWKDRLKRDGLCTTLRLELRELLKPKIIMKKPFRWGEGDDEVETPERLRQLVDWELALAADHVHSSLRDLTDERWQEALPALLDDFQQLLRDALDLLRELGEADNRRDRSLWDMPSISPHWQNRGFRDWVTLIELLRDAWLVVRSNNLVRARRIAQGWFDVPYPTFKRLALFAASQESCIASEQWVDWLLTDDAWWLWSVDTQRETMRLLVLQGSYLSPVAQARLEAAILAGPPHEIYRDDIEPERLQHHKDEDIWLLLAKMNSSGIALGLAASECLDALSAAYPHWQLAANERDEFSHWMSGTGDPDYDESRNIDLAPRKWRELVKWLKQPPPEQRPFYEDTWRETCRTRFFHSLYALRILAREGLWPPGRWREALQVWGEEEMTIRSWRFAAPIVQTMPDSVLQEIAHGVTWWLERISKPIKQHEDILLDLCRRVLALQHQDGMDTDQPVTRAINHPIGHVTQSLLNLWFKREPGDNDKLSADIEPFFTRLCDRKVEQFRHGRVLLASRLIALFRVDRPWAEEHLLPLLDWTVDPAEAKATWEGFLWSPRLYRPLLIAFKSQFLDTARHYAELGEHCRQFAAFLTYAALDPVDGYTTQEYQSAIGTLPQEGLQEAAQALSQAQEGAGNQREDYWRNRIQPFWQKVWPKSRDLASKGIAESLTRLTIATGNEFPSAVMALQDWLRPIEHPHYVVHRLYESDLCAQFPADALRLLDLIISDQPWAPRELAQCLNVISQVSPTLLQDRRYQRLAEYMRRRGI